MPLRSFLHIDIELLLMLLFYYFILYLSSNSNKRSVRDTFYEFPHIRLTEVFLKVISLFRFPCLSSLRKRCLVSFMPPTGLIAQVCLVQSNPQYFLFSMARHISLYSQIAAAAHYRSRCSTQSSSAHHTRHSIYSSPLLPDDPCCRE